MRLNIKTDNIVPLVNWCTNNIGPVVNDDGLFGFDHVENRYYNQIRGEKWVIHIYSQLDSCTLVFDARRIKQVHKTWFKLQWGWNKC